MRLNPRLFCNKRPLELPLLLAVLLASPFQAQARMSSEDMRRIFVECLTRATQSTLGTSVPNPAAVKPKNFLEAGVPLVAKDGLTLYWNDGNTEPFVHKYDESDSM